MRLFAIICQNNFSNSILLRFAHLLARTFLLFFLRRRTRFFLHLALIVNDLYTISINIAKRRHVLDRERSYLKKNFGKFLMRLEESCNIEGVCVTKSIRAKMRGTLIPKGCARARTACQQIHAEVLHKRALLGRYLGRSQTCIRTRPYSPTGVRLDILDLGLHGAWQFRTETIVSVSFKNVGQSDWLPETPQS